MTEVSITPFEKTCKLFWESHYGSEWDDLDETTKEIAKNSVATILRTFAKAEPTGRMLGHAATAWHKSTEDNYADIAKEYILAGIPEEY